MSRKKLRLFRMLTVMTTGGLIGWSVAIGNAIIPIPVAIGGLALLHLLRKQVKEVIEDERIHKINEKASRATLQIFGVVIALGIALQDVPENIATIVHLYGLTKKRIKSFLITTATILFELLGFILGYYLLKEISLNWLGASLAMAAGFMVYISIEELIPAAQIKRLLRKSVLVRKLPK